MQYFWVTAPMDIWNMLLLPPYCFSEAVISLFVTATDMGKISADWTSVQDNSAQFIPRDMAEGPAASVPQPICALPQAQEQQSWGFPAVGGYRIS